MKEIKKLIDNWKGHILNEEMINESGLGRLRNYIVKYDCAILSANRGNPEDMSKCVSGGTEMEKMRRDMSTIHINARPTPEDQAINPRSQTEIEQHSSALNIERTKELKATLIALKMSVTDVDGTYVENFNMPDAVEVQEDSLFVVNTGKAPSLEAFIRVMAYLGQRYCQDSVLIIPRGGEDAFLYGTNNAWPGLGNRVKVGRVVYGHESEFMTRVDGRPMTTRPPEPVMESYNKLSRLGRQAVMAISNLTMKDYKEKP